MSLTLKSETRIYFVLVLLIAGSASSPEPTKLPKALRSRLRERSAG